MKSIRAAIYTRVSTLEQAAKGYSLDAQREKLLAYAKSQGYEVYNVYTDDGYSAKDLHRPAMSQLIEHIKLGLINIVIVYKLDRLSRRVRDVLELLDDVFSPFNVQLYSLHENIDVSSPFGRAALKLNATFSELERETIVDRMIMGKEQAVKQGKYLCPGKVAPFGYVRNPATKRLDTVPEEADMVVKLFDLYIQGYSFRKLQDYALANFNHPYFNNPMSCKPIIKRSMYSGYFTYKGELHKGTNYDPIISYETYLKANAQLEKNKTIRKHDSSPYLLTGLVFCAKCGNRYVGKMYKHIDGQKEYVYRAYGCAARIKRDKTYHSAKCDNKIYTADELEKRVLNNVRALRFAEFVAGKYISGAAENIRMEIGNLKARKEKLLDLYLSEIFSKQDFLNKVSDLDKQIEKNEKILAEEEQKIKDTPTLTIDYLKDLHTHFDELSHADKRKFLDIIIDKIILINDDIVIKYTVK